VEQAGGHVAERIPCVAEPAVYAELYLRTKKEKLGHLLEL